MFTDSPTAKVYVNNSTVGSVLLILEDESLLLTCNTTGEPVPTISWTKDKNRCGVGTCRHFHSEIIMITMIATILCRIKANGIDVVLSGDRLLITSVRKKDSGTYNCIASSPAGATTDAVAFSVIGIIS